MKFLSILLVLVLSICCCHAADPTDANPSKNPRFFYGELTTEVSAITEAFIGCVFVEDVSLLWATAAVSTTDSATLTGDLYIYGSDKKVTSHLASPVFAIDDGSSIQSWSTAGAQTPVNITDIRPCRWLVFTSVVSTAATTPATPVLTIRGIRFGEGGELAW